MNLDAYDDMMGLEFGEYGLDGLFDPQMLKEALIAATAGGGAILLSLWGTKQLAAKIDLKTKVPNDLARAAIMSGVTFMIGVAGGRALYGYNREAAMGVVGGLGAIAMANLLDVGLQKMTGNPSVLAGLSEGAYGDDGMSALAALEATSVNAAPGAFQGFAGPTVTPEQLMGFEAAVTQTETLGEYSPYMA